MQIGHKYTEIGQLKIYNRIVRNSFLLPYEQQVTLLFVLDRTVGWKKSHSSISISEFEHGVFREKSNSRTLIVPGTGLPPERVTLALGALKGSGAIEVDQVKSNTWYGINEEWHHPDFSPASSWQPWTLNESDYVYDDE